MMVNMVLDQSTRANFK